MRVTELSGLALVTRMAAMREQQQQRSPGVHVSTLVQSLVRTLRLVKTYDDDDKKNELQPMFWEMGCIWEASVCHALAAMYPGSHKPEPRCCDGVWASPDWYRPTQQTIDEIKLTWTKHTDASHPKVQAYLWQLKAYMHVWNVTRGCVHVGYVRGNYADKPVDYRLYIVRCTQKELREWWEDLIAHGRDVGILPTGVGSGDWEAANDQEEG